MILFFVIVFILAVCITGPDNQQSKAKRTADRARAQQKWSK